MSLVGSFLIIIRRSLSAEASLVLVSAVKDKVLLRSNFNLNLTAAKGIIEFAKETPRESRMYVI
jgi:hypothetical protein